MVNCKLGIRGEDIVQCRQDGDSITYLAISEIHTASLTRGCNY